MTDTRAQIDHHHQKNSARPDDDEEDDDDEQDHVKALKSLILTLTEADGEEEGKRLPQAVLRTVPEQYAIRRPRHDSNNQPRQKRKNQDEDHHSPKNQTPNGLAQVSELLKAENNKKNKDVDVKGLRMAEAQEEAVVLRRPSVWTRRTPIPKPNSHRGQQQVQADAIRALESSHHLCLDDQAGLSARTTSITANQQHQSKFEVSHNNQVGTTIADLIDKEDSCLRRLSQSVNNPPPPLQPNYRQSGRVGGNESMVTVLAQAPPPSSNNGSTSNANSNRNPGHAQNAGSVTTSRMHRPSFSHPLDGTRAGAGPFDEEWSTTFTNSSSAAATAGGAGLRMSNVQVGASPSFFTYYDEDATTIATTNTTDMLSSEQRPRRYSSSGQGGHGHYRSSHPPPPNSGVVVVPPGRHASAVSSSASSSAMMMMMMMNRGSPTSAVMGGGNIAVESNDVHHLAEQAKVRWKIGILVVLTIAAGVAVGITALMLNNHKNSQNNNSDIATDDGQAKSSPANPPPLAVQQAYLEDLKTNILLPPDDDDDDGVNDNIFQLDREDESVRIRALEWLAFEDHLLLDIGTSSRLRQRYGLMVLYYSAGGAENWNFGLASTWATPSSSSHTNNDNNNIVVADDLSSNDESIWSATSPWAVPGVHECTWFFVKCSQFGDVIALEIPREIRLSGTIPRELGYMPFLEHLILNSNRLEGMIPTALYDLKRLQTLDLSENELSSKIQTHIGLLCSGSLRSLQLQRNFFTGALPTELALCKHLEHFDVRYNDLSGDTVFQSSNEERARGGYSILEQWGQYGKIKHIALSNNLRFTADSIPTELGLVTSLTHLEFSHIALAYGSTIPSEIGQLTNLEELRFKWTGGLSKTSQAAGSGGTDADSVDNGSDEPPYEDLPSPIPSELGQCTKLSILEMGGNRNLGPYSFPIDAIVPLHDSLEILSVHFTSMTGTLPTELGLMTKLAILFGQGNDLAGTIPTELTMATKLDVLDVSSNSLEGDFPSELCNSKITATSKFSVDCTVFCECCTDYTNNCGAKPFG